MGASATIEQLIQAFQAEESAPAWQRAAEHLLRIAGQLWTTLVLGCNGRMRQVPTSGAPGWLFTVLQGAMCGRQPPSGATWRCSGPSTCRATLSLCSWRSTPKLVSPRSTAPGALPPLACKSALHAPCRGAGAQRIKGCACCRWLGCCDFLDEGVDLGLGRSALVTGARIPAAKKGLWLWAHKVWSAGNCLGSGRFFIAWSSCTCTMPLPL